MAIHISVLALAYQRRGTWTYLPSQLHWGLSQAQLAGAEVTYQYRDELWRWKNVCRTNRLHVYEVKRFGVQVGVCGTREFTRVKNKELRNTGIYTNPHYHIIVGSHWKVISITITGVRQSATPHLNDVIGLIAGCGGNFTWCMTFGWEFFQYIEQNYL